MRRAILRRRGDPYGRIWLHDSASGYSRPGLAYTRTGAFYVPQQDGTLQLVPADTLPREWVPSLSRYGTRMDPGWTQGCLRTSGFSNATWNKTGLLAVAQDAAGPNGGTDSWKVVESAVSSGHYVEQSIGATNGSPACLVAIASPRSGDRYMTLSMGAAAFGADAIATFNLASGASVKNATATACGALQLANGNWLCWMTAAATATASAPVRVSLNDTFSASAAPSYLGNGTSGISLWACNVTNTSYPVPYVSSAGSATVIGAPSWAGSLVAIGRSAPSEYGVFAEYMAIPMAGSIPFRNAIQLDSGGGNDRSYLRYNNAASAARGIITAGGVTQLTASFVAPEGGLVKQAMRISASQSRAALNGALSASPADVTMPATPTHVRLGHNASGSEVLPGYVFRAALIPRAPGESELQAMTA